MHRLKSISNVLPQNILRLYTEQLSAKSSWFILDHKNNQIILRNNSFNELFEYQENDSEILYLNNLPFIQTSYVSLNRVINNAVITNLFSEELINIEMKNHKVITTWVSLQPIIIKQHTVALLVHIQPIETPINMINSHPLKIKDYSSKCEHCYNFSKTEQSILNLVLAGFSQKDVCKKLNLSRTRITQYISQLCYKCGYTGYSGKYLKKYFSAIQ